MQNGMLGVAVMAAVAALASCSPDDDGSPRRSSAAVSHPSAGNDRPGQAAHDSFSNVLPADYVGPEACAECHKKNYDSWKLHPHSQMNMLESLLNLWKESRKKDRLRYLGTVYRQETLLQ